MKISIITLLGYINYGNRLQNYALEQILKEEGYDVVTISGIYIGEMLRPSMVVRGTRNRVKYIVKSWFFGIFSIKWYYTALSAYKEIRYGNLLMWNRKRRFKDFVKRNDDILSPIFCNTKSDIKRHPLIRQADFFIAGSDQVWNPDFLDSFFGFLKFAPPQKRLSFSASIGHDENFHPDRKWVSGALNMKYLSVREQSAADAVYRLTGRKADVVPDPTLLLGGEKWKKVERKPSLKLPKQYILTYFLGKNPNAINEFSRKKNLPLVQLNNRKFPGLYCVDPEEFVWLFHYAKYVLTDSFHGTAFSLIFHKDFYVFKRREEGMENMFSRISDLLNKVDLLEREVRWSKIPEKPSISGEKWKFIDGIFENERRLAMDKIGKQVEMRC